MRQPIIIFYLFPHFLLQQHGTWVTEKIIVPGLGEYKGNAKADEIKSLSREEKTGLVYAAVAVLIFGGIILLGLIPENGFLRDPHTVSVF
ncbi:MAG: AbgT family transporter [Ignavibacteriales bacterium]|nr:AbgT family transporter [Ignavibacteriales bacterium]